MYLKMFIYSVKNAKKLSFTSLIFSLFICKIAAVFTHAKDFDRWEKLVVELHNSEVQVEHQSDADRLFVALKKNARTNG